MRSQCQQGRSNGQRPRRPAEILRRETFGEASKRFVALDAHCSKQEKALGSRKNPKSHSISDVQRISYSRRSQSLLERELSAAEFQDLLLQASVDTRPVFAPPLT